MAPTQNAFTPIDSSRVFILNNGRMSENVFVNLKLSGKIVLDTESCYVFTVYLDARNLLNTLNVRWMDSNGKIGGGLGDPSAYYDPRRIRLGVRLEL